MATTQNKLSLEQKLVEIRRGAGYVQKTKAGYGYKFSPEEEILAKVTPLLTRHKVLLHKNIVPGTFRVTPSVYQKVDVKLDKSGNPIKTEKTVTEFICEAELLFVFVNAENPEEKIEIPWAMVAVQSDASFAFGGSLTYATRMFWMKQLDMATSEYDQDEYVAKQRESEDREQREIAKSIIAQVDGIVQEQKMDDATKNKFIAELKKVIRIDGKPGTNYMMVSDPAVASRVLATVKKFFNVKEVEE